jgi:hypothetical protein
MKKVFLMTGLLVGLGLYTMAQTTPAAPKKETKKEAVHHKADKGSKEAHAKKHSADKKAKENKN